MWGSIYPALGRDCFHDSKAEDFYFSPTFYHDDLLELDMHFGNRFHGRHALSSCLERVFSRKTCMIFRHNTKQGEVVSF
jgi:hypothetical protein